MDTTQPTALLGGLSPQQFMKRHWQRKPLLVRGAIAHMQPLLRRQQLFELAGSEDVESRLVVRKDKGWQVRQGPFLRRGLPALSQPDWTLLVQGVDLHVQSVHELLQRFRFVPEARLDDLMISYASDGGGVGPHFDSYDVFLLQAEGRRRWRIGRQADLTLREDTPLKVLAHFEPEQEFVLEPGDMLYLPPRYAHDGIAEGGDCQTYSIGFRAPRRGELARELFERLAEEANEEAGEEGGPAQQLYRDAAQPATESPGAIPAGLQAFAQETLHKALGQPGALARILGEYLTEPKERVWFEPGAPWSDGQGVALDRRTRMMYDAQHVFINGEGYRAAGRDATLMRRLADARRLGASELRRCSPEAMELLRDWCDAGWLQAWEDGPG